MPILDPRERSIPVLPSIIIMNIIPLIGIIYYDLTFFALFYLYWWETVFISFFQWLKMGKAQKITDPDPGYTVNGKMLTHEQVNSKRYMRRSYFWIRSFMLIFYLIFIIVFVGVLSAVNDGEGIEFLRAIIFADDWMKLAIVAFILTHLLDYFVWVKDEEYKETSLRELGMPFDSRIILMHLVIVLGTFGSMYVSESLFPEHPKAGSIAYASLFVLIKLMIDIWAYTKNSKRSVVLSRLTQSPKLNK